jgi:hypothetical protein
MRVGRIGMIVGGAGLALVVAAGGAGVAGAQQGQMGAQPEGAAEGEGKVKIELNKLETVDDACRVYLVIENETPTDFTTLQVELVSFDSDGLIGQRLAVDLGPLRPEKTLVKLFDMPQARCESVDRLLLNDVLACESGEAATDNCLDLLVPGSRASTKFWK